MIVSTVILSSLLIAGSWGNNVRNIFWNTTTAATQGQGYKTVVVNQGNQAWEYDQVNIICPVYKTGESEESEEQHIIYSVRKEEFEQCRVTSPRPRIVAICNRPRTFMYFTLTFRSFTPTPGGLEFRPGQDYYFVSTSSKLDIHRRVGGYCRTHNMRMVFRVAHREDQEEAVKMTSPSPVPIPAAYWSKYWNSRVPSQKDNYVYSPNSRHSSLQYQQNSRDTYFGHEGRHHLGIKDNSVDIRITGRTFSSNSFSLSISWFLVVMITLLNAGL